jgi:hypothetical protein
VENSGKHAEIATNGIRRNAAKDSEIDPEMRARSRLRSVSDFGANSEKSAQPDPAQSHP